MFCVHDTRVSASYMQCVTYKKIMQLTLALDAFAIFVAQYLYIFVLILGAIYFFTRPKRVMKSMLICGVIVAPLAFIISRIAQLFYYDPRPFVVGHFTPLIAHAADNGFPSDHMLLASAVAMIVSFYSKKWGIVFWALALLIGWARVFVGVHHWTDIIGSVVINLVAGLAYYFTAGRRGKPAERRG